MINTDLFPKKLFKKALEVTRLVQKAGFDIYFVGGAVRDIVLGISPYEIDMATSARPEQIEKLFRKIDAKGKKYGVICVLIDEYKFDIATFRKDGIYIDGRRPKNVEFTLDMKEDSNRRDFTMNALYYNPISGELFDYHGGLKDIENKIIKTIGPAQKRLKEDGLRVLRAFKFSKKLDFKISDDILDVIQHNEGLLDGISKKRILLEIAEISAKKV
jgi:tRNA nucleotidyltransferase (CCA-adding enzyme)